ncbi:MAG: RNA-binding protein [Bacteroidales bacterium]|nr:RNA-binding protein [Bacteroidales bacterium]MCF8403379.1 RNA-binding protein [Bacteroidales bacterium]
MNIYVGNLSYGVDEGALEQAFKEFGEVTSVKIITDKFTGRSKGFAFVEMTNDDEAKNAISELNGKSMDNRDITVNEARPKRDDNRGRW